jgi:hypothetical protein
MHILFILLFLLVWLFILWLGSVALESTGMERSRARFHALSALSGTGFTTSHAEAIVEHPVRRRIVATLIFIGNAGIFSFLISFIILGREGFTVPELHVLIVSAVIIVLLLLAYFVGLIDKITNGLLRLSKPGRNNWLFHIGKIFYETGDYALAQLNAGKPADGQHISLNDIDFKKYNLNLIALERQGKIEENPLLETRLNSGDTLLCYGKLTGINKFIEQYRGDR